MMILVTLFLQISLGYLHIFNFSSLSCTKKNRFLQTHRSRVQTCGCQGERKGGKRWVGSLGLADANTNHKYIKYIHIYNT